MIKKGVMTDNRSKERKPGTEMRQLDKDREMDGWMTKRSKIRKM